MEYTNQDMERMRDALEPLLKRDDVIGYAAARNWRILGAELTEYSKKRDELIMEYGTPEVDDSGNPTGRVSLTIDSPSFKDFAARMEPFAKIEHEPSLFTIDYGEAIGRLTGSELLQVDWMFEDKE